MRRFRFTLVELLVVITVIAVLAALLMPALKQAIDTARAVACMSNLKQMALGLTEYAGDYHNHYPPVKHLIPQNGPGLTWHGFLYPYLGINRPGDPNKFWWFAHERIFLCPSKQGKKLEWGTSSYGMSWFNSCNGSVHPCANTGNCEEKHYWKADENGSKTVYAADSPGKSSGTDHINIFRGAYPKLRHPGEKANLLLWDLHVRGIRWLPAIMDWGAAAPRFDRSNHLRGSTSGNLNNWYENEYSP